MEPKPAPTNRIFDEMDGIMRAYVLILRQANIEKRVMESALQRIANGGGDGQRLAMEALITIGKLRVKDGQIETPEMGIDAHFAEQRAVGEQLRDVRMGAVSGKLHGSLAAVSDVEMRDLELR
jgi:hypothetical protein